MKYSTMKQLLAVTVFAAIALTVISCGGRKAKPGELSGKVTISGAFALYPLAVQWADEFMKENPAVRIDISAGGAGKGMTDALSGMVDLAMVSREVAKEEVNNGAWKIAVAKDAVLPTVNASNPFLADILSKGISKARLSALYKEGTIKYWGELLGTASVDKINLYTRSDACGAAEMWASFIGGHQENLLGVGVFGDPGIADAVTNDKFALGYNNLIYAFDLKTRKCYPGIVIPPIDLNGDGKIEPEERFYESLDSIASAIKDGRYPSPPSRNLYFVSKGAPTNPITIAFLKFILTKGQQHIPTAGYIQLNDEKIIEMLKMIDNQQ
ncbi:PstS family phosphate ABC transporter substrate-binding protein [Williamwhitmania taraxaci]|uniref:Phosphate transport system substrate-binding protein n=1 Tax=Williamwhitmania taraxaci TaxID=1640674 RepID=A0A1G6QYA8_9BACT|nr:substrate-binding domain-containing protein [Williamwhitmania taraxaci]SDC97312.1 phosphate transport system substrate-binding protein [Williamwhitmania taraxaci]